MTSDKEHNALADGLEALDGVEVLARALHHEKWPGKAWAGCDVSRSYWRRRARSVLTGEKGV